MSKDAAPADPVMSRLRKAALRHSAVEEGLACKGTVIQSATLKVRGRSFLFLRPGRIMIKLQASRDEAMELAKKSPDHYKIGAGGWTTVTYAVPKDVSLPMLERWIAESYG